MHCDDLAGVQSWFEGYSRSFLTGDPQQDSPLALKMEHTDRVRRNMRLLAQSIGLSDRYLCIAETVGWLHDVGRFEQYRRYGTFNDRRSANHATLGIKVVNQERILDELAEDDRQMILEAVRFHNAPVLPSNRPLQTLSFMRLIRDADKLDIWKIFGDYFRCGLSPEAAIVQHLSDQPVWEAAIVKAIQNRRMARFSAMTSVTDFKLLQLSWVFDLNYPETFAQAKQRGDLAAIARTLPDAPEVKQAVSVVMACLDDPGGQFHDHRWARHSTANRSRLEKNSR